MKQSRMRCSVGRSGSRFVLSWLGVWGMVGHGRGSGIWDNMVESVGPNIVDKSVAGPLKIASLRDVRLIIVGVESSKPRAMKSMVLTQDLDLDLSIVVGLLGEEQMG